MLWFLLWVSLLGTCASNQNDKGDLYFLLGVHRSATTAEIKRAYRRKALDTHPDKNLGIPTEEAAEAFRQVVEAFEVLSDPNSRRRYDQTGLFGNNNNNNNNNAHQHPTGSSSFTFQFNQFFHQQYRWTPPIHPKDKPEVKQAQARLMHIVSWEQFQTVLMDDEGHRLERHVLLAAVNPQLEQYVMDEMLFPYPFAGMSPQQIWWEDVLQSVMVRYHNHNELTQKLGLPKGQELTRPIFLLGKLGQTMDEPWLKLETSNREELERWIWNELQVEVEFVNHHDHAVEIYWIHGNRAFLKISHLPPHERQTHVAHLTHEFHIRDVRVDTIFDSPGRWKLTEPSSLLTFRLQNATYLLEADTKITLHIPPRTCYDWSGHCPFWQAHENACSQNPDFMHDYCPLTCQVCSDEHDQILVRQAQQGTFTPPSSSPLYHDSDEPKEHDFHDTMSAVPDREEEEADDDSEAHESLFNDEL